MAAPSVSGSSPSRSVWESFHPRPNEELSEVGPDLYVVTIGSVEEAFSIDGSQDPQAFIAALADRVQTVLMEDRQEMTPPCPLHPGDHPLTAAVIGEAVWVCPVEETPVRPIVLSAW